MIFYNSDYNCGKHVVFCVAFFEKDAMTLSFLQLSNDLWEGEEVLTASLHAGVTQEAVCKLWLRLLCFSSDVCVCLRLRAGQASLDTRITFSLTWTWGFCEYDLCQRVLLSVADRKSLCLMLNETAPTFPEHCEVTDWCKLVPVGVFYWGGGTHGLIIRGDWQWPFGHRR